MDTTGFDTCPEFLLPDGSSCKNFIIFGVNMSPSVHIDETKDILILGEGPTYGLDDTTLTAEAKYYLNSSS